MSCPLAVATCMLAFSLALELLIQIFCEDKKEAASLNLVQWQSGACMILLFALGWEAYFHI